MNSPTTNTRPHLTMYTPLVAHLAAHEFTPPRTHLAGARVTWEYTRATPLLDAAARFRSQLMLMFDAIRDREEQREASHA